MLNEIRVELVEHGLSIFEPENRVAIYDEFTQSGLRLDRLLERNPTWRPARIRRGTLSRLASSRSNPSFAQLIKVEDKPAPQDQSAMQEARAFLSDQRKQIAAERKELDAAQTASIERARRAAEADLPLKSRGFQRTIVLKIAE